MKKLLYPALAAMAIWASPSQAATSPRELPLYAGKPLLSWHITVADFEAQQALTGSSAAVPWPPVWRSPF